MGDRYAYSKPRVGNEDEVLPSPAPRKYTRVAVVHSHGKSRSGYRGNFLQGHDVDFAREWNVIVFVSTPNGSMLRFDPAIDVEGDGDDNYIDVFMPSDPEDPYRRNSVNPFNLPKNEPTWGWSEWWDDLWGDY